MKALIILSTLFAVITGHAECTTSTSYDENSEVETITTDVPPHLKGAVITITLADGSTSTVPAEKFKVVPRIQQFVVTRAEKQTTKICGPNKNRVSGLAGRGPVRTLRSTNYGNFVSVETETGTILGAQYQRLVTDRVSVGLQATDNGSGLLTLGLDF